MTADLPSTASLSLAASRRSPLHHLASLLAATGSSTSVSLTEAPFRTMIEVRSRHPEREPPKLDKVSEGSAIGRMADVLGGLLPQRAREVAPLGERHALWLGPGWWLITGPPEPDTEFRWEAGLAASLREAAAAVSVVDVSAHRTTLRLTGPHARTVLEHGCSLDLHPRAFTSGMCASTTVAKAQTVLHQTDATTYQILVRGSFADYLARWLLDAMVEWVPVPSDGPVVPTARSGLKWGRRSR